MSATPVAQLKGVVKRYGKRVALNGLDLAVPRGALFGLVGANGAGKTTALTIMAGLTRPDRGSIDLLGLGPFSPSRHGGRITLLPQDARLPREAGARELLVYYGELQGLARGHARDEADRLLTEVHLADRARARIRTLSHGMRRRVMVAQAFLNAPDLVLLDEPLSGLDPREVANLRAMLCRLRGDRTLVLSSHNLHELQRVCDHVAFIDHGRVVRTDTMDAITGRQHVLVYEMGSDKVPLAELQAQLPGIDLHVDPDERRLTCGYDDTRSAAEVNRIALRVLLDAGVDILGVRQGKELEAAYLEHGGQGSRSQGKGKTS